MSRKRWKDSERAVAQFLGGERVPVSGRARGWAPDVEHRWLAIEVKSTKKLPVYLAKAMDQAQKADAWSQKRGAGKRLPVAIIHEDGQHFRNSLIVLRLGDFVDFFGDGRPRGADQVHDQSGPGEDAEWPK